MEELRERLKALKWMETLQEDQQSHLTLKSGSSVTEAPTKGQHRQERGSWHICSRWATQSSCATPIPTGGDALPKAASDYITWSLTGLPCLDSVGEDGRCTYTHRFDVPVGEDTWEKGHILRGEKEGCGIRMDHEGTQGLG